MSSITSSAVTFKDPKLFRQACYIDGAWIDPTGHATIDVDNPATGEVVGSVPRLGRAETRAAIDAAARAFPEWRKKTAKEREAGRDKFLTMPVAVISRIN